MSLGEGFARQDLVEKHGNKGQPGYHLLHPGRVKGATHGGTGATVGEQKAVNQRKRLYGAAIQNALKKPAGPQRDKALSGILARVTNDSVLGTKDYDAVLDELERAHGGRSGADMPDAPKKAPAKRAAAKKPAPVKVDNTLRRRRDRIDFYNDALDHARNGKDVDQIEQDIENDGVLLERDKQHLAGKVNEVRDAGKGAKAPAKAPNGLSIERRYQARLDRVERRIKAVQPGDADAVHAIDVELGRANIHALRDDDLKRLRAEIRAKRDKVKTPAPPKKARGTRTRNEVAAAGPGADSADVRAGRQDVVHFLNQVGGGRDPQERKAFLQQALVVANGREDMHKILRAINTYLGPGMHRDQMMRMWDRKRDELAAQGKYKTAGVADGSAHRGRQRAATPPKKRNTRFRALIDRMRNAGDSDEARGLMQGSVDNAKFKGEIDTNQRALIVDTGNRRLREIRAARLAAANGGAAPANALDPKRPNAPKVWGIEVAVDFPAAKMAQFLDEKDASGKKAFDPARGDIIYLNMTNDRARKFKELAEARGLTVRTMGRAGDDKGQVNDSIMRRMDRKAGILGGRQNVLVLRKPGGTLVDRDGLAEKWAGRPNASFGALVGNPDGAQFELNAQEIQDMGGAPSPARQAAPAGAGPRNRPAGAVNRVGDANAPADGPDGNWVDAGPPWPKALTTGTPAADHFANGGSLADAPEDGLFDFIFQQDGVERVSYFVLPGQEGVRGGGPSNRPTYKSTDPKKFEVKKLGGGISSSWQVYELDAQGKRVSWRMFKGSNGFQAWDIEDEVVVNDFLQRAGVEVPKVGYARNPGHKGPKWIVSEHGGKLNPQFDEGDVKKAKIMDAKDMRDPGALRPYRDGVLLMDILDFIIGNGDRHQGNWMVTEMPDGSYKPVIIDNGGADFRGAGGQFHSGRNMGIVGNLYQGDDAAMDRDIEKVQKMLGSVDVDAMIDAHLARAGLSPAFRQHLEDTRAQLRHRVRVLAGMRSEDVRSHYTGRRR